MEVADYVGKMKNQTSRGYSLLLLSLLFPTVIFNLVESQPGGRRKGRDVVLHTFPDRVVLDNGILSLTLSKPQGGVIGIQYGGIDNLMDTHRRQSNIGYWDINWIDPGVGPKFDTIEGREFKVVTATPDQVEVSFIRNWNPSFKGTTQMPLNIDIRYILLRGSSGFYPYAIYERLPGFPACNLGQTRMVFRLRKDKFSYMTIADNKRRTMPTEEDRSPRRSKQLAYPEAVILTDPTNPALKGQVDDKYQYSLENKDGGVYGWVSSNPMVGFWIIFSSQEYRNGGPTKQSLTLHVGPTCLVMFHSTHYMGDASSCVFENGEVWRKVFGPFYVHLNSHERSTYPFLLWEEAKQQKLLQERMWPYPFPTSPYFFKKEARCSIYGRLLVQDRFISPKIFPANGAYIGLASPGEIGSWQNESKGYQFWAKTNSKGFFHIANILPGEYNLYGWVPTIVGDYKNEKIFKLSQGSSTNLGNLVYNSPRNGPTIWELGVPDRSAMEFFIPDPNPLYVNPLFIKSIEKYRQYGLWERYADLYSHSDLVYSVGVNDYKINWFFAHVARRNADGTYQATTWQIKFHLNTVISNGTYNLLIAVASSTRSTLEIRFNNPNVRQPHFQTPGMGKDNAIARHGIHGFYQNFNVKVNHFWLRQGENTIFLTQRQHRTPFSGILYDYLRFEGPGPRISD